jgi:hypothetical protein
MYISSTSDAGCTVKQRSLTLIQSTLSRTLLDMLSQGGSTDAFNNKKMLRGHTLLSSKSI